MWVKVSLKWVWVLDKGKGSGSRSTLESVQVLDKPMKGYRSRKERQWVLD